MTCMHKRIPIGRLETERLALRPTTGFAVLSPKAQRVDIAKRTKRPKLDAPLAAPAGSSEPNPYLDYERHLTDEGGIRMTYKSVDRRMRHTIWRLAAWTIFTGLEAAYLFYTLSPPTIGLHFAFLVVAAWVNWETVAKEIEIYRTVEIRPDCMIVWGYYVFWSRFMEGGLPAFRRDEDGDQTLCGTYGTRYVEYFTISRADDECDRMPEVFAAHLSDAMRQLWNRPP